MSAPEIAVIDAVVALGRALRDRGLAVTVDEEVLVCQALGEVDVRSRDEVYWASRACFVQRPDQIPVFDAVFERFWAGASLEAAAMSVEHGETDPRMAGPQQGGDSLPQFRLEGRSGSLLGGQPSKASREIPAAPGNERGRGHRPGVLAAYSPLDVVSEGRRLSYEDAELAAVRHLAAALRAAAPERLSRRAQRARRAGQLDVRRTLRQALRTDGDLVRPAYLAASRRPRRLLFVCDVSGSMERYSRVLLASLHAAVSAQIKAEAFVFATRLTRLTGKLSSRDVASALAAARAQVADWSGGTRIGEAVSRFNRQYARLGLARGAIVIIASDGWDRGDPELLSRELQRLRLQCRRLVWLNPRPAELHGQPLAIGMRAALPCIDDFVPSHDPRAVEQLVRVIRGLGEQRPVRPQRALGWGEAVTMHVAVVGKGGSGKSVLAGTLARVLARRGHRVLTLDSDLMPGLSLSLGLGIDSSAMLTGAVEKNEEGRWRLRKGTGPVRAIARYSVEGPDGIRHLQLGKLNEEGQKAIMPSTNGFYQVIHRLSRSRAFDSWTIVGDLPAGPRQLSYRWAPYADTLLLVVEPSRKSALTARRIAAIARSVPDTAVVPIANKVMGLDDRRLVEEMLGEPVAAAIPADDVVAIAERQGLAPIDNDPGSPAIRAIEALATTLERDAATDRRVA